MEEYENIMEKKNQKRSYISQNAHTWTDVLKELDNASSEYNDPSGKWGKMRQHFRSSSNKAASFSAWLQVLPSQWQYFLILYDGIKLIFGAASRLNDLREEIERALCKIPVLLSCTNRNLNVFKNSPGLHRSSADMYVAVIALLQHILHYYQLKSAKKFTSVLLKQGEYDKEMTDKIAMLEIRSNEFFQVAQTCSHEAIERTSNYVKHIRKHQATAFLRTNA